MAQTRSQAARSSRLKKAREKTKGAAAAAKQTRSNVAKAKREKKRKVSGAQDLLEVQEGMKVDLAAMSRAAKAKKNGMAAQLEKEKAMKARADAKKRKKKSKTQTSPPSSYRAGTLGTGHRSTGMGRWNRGGA